MRHNVSELLYQHEPLADKIKAMHERLLRSVPVIDRVACVLYDARSDLLKTFINSTRQGIPINGYEFALAESTSLSRLAETGDCRVIDDIAEVIRPDSPHSSWLLEQGYQSSFTVPLFDFEAFAGFVFFNSMQAAAFTPERQRDALMFANLLGMAILTERMLVRNILQSANVAREVARLRDFETGAHLDRMAHYSRLIAKGVADIYALNDEFIEHVFLFAPLHDIGKVGIPDAILLKPGRLDKDEWQIMQSHVELGLQLADRVITELKLADHADSKIIRNLIGGHHEMLDGSGYPAGLKGEQVPIEARIVTVSDIFDALTTERPYKQAWPFEEAFAELDRMAAAGKIDPCCVAALKSESDKARVIHSANPDR